MTRKTKTALITVCLLLTVTVVYALAAAGGASDPLASLSYLTGTFTDAVDQRVEEKLDASDQALLNGDAAPSDGGAATWMETRLKAGDALTCGGCHHRDHRYQWQCPYSQPPVSGG